ncbi:nickel ABC transporter permease [Bacillus sp. KH172YL63]|uniref:nickel ABC transporter permease n=1 Tax=Bacillus sp. KH172YL63 TaxID=2709784 RepID=UPI0013E484BA|nr:nickel ABC transporter permease [Bacillus sp. KH172YL63]BCB05275.1 ABC transporter permease [Bacillus sp. KH172YL63]
MNLIARRVTEFILFLTVLSFVSFTFIHLAPGDPLDAMLQTDEVAVSGEQKELLRRELGLNEPLYIQYGRWMLKFFRWDLGESYTTKQPVMDELLDRLPATVQLTMMSLVVMTVISVPLGSLAAVCRNRWIDQLSRVFALLGASVPSFWMGLLLIDLFAVKLGMLPSMGMGTFTHLILPSVTLGLAMSAVYVRILRSSLLDSLGQDFVRAARARGLSRKRVFFAHAFRHSLTPVITMFGVSLGSLLGGTVVIEVLFAYPGIGKLVVDSILERDYPVIQGYIFFMGLLVMMINLTVDASYRFLHPEIRLKEVKRQWYEREKSAG